MPLVAQIEWVPVIDCRSLLSFGNRYCILTCHTTWCVYELSCYKVHGHIQGGGILALCAQCALLLDEVPL